MLLLQLNPFMHQKINQVEIVSLERIKQNWRNISVTLCLDVYDYTGYLCSGMAAPPPSNVTEWFILCRSNPVVGLFYLGLADVVIMILWIPMVLALYILLIKNNGTWMTISMIFIIVGVAVYIATNTAFSLLSLSKQFEAATSEAERSIILAAGQSFIALTEGTAARYLGMPLVWLSGMIISGIMLKGNQFRRATAWVGIFGLGLLIVSVPFAGYTTTGSSTIPVIAIIFVTYTGGGILSLIWYIMVGIRLLKTRNQ
jgi:hypothetical protein